MQGAFMFLHRKSSSVYLFVFLPDAAFKHEDFFVNPGTAGLKYMEWFLRTRLFVFMQIQLTFQVKVLIFLCK
jgi:hypothetical protein